MARSASPGQQMVVALFRDALGVFDRIGEPRWLALERLLNAVIDEWEPSRGIATRIRPRRLVVRRPSLHRAARVAGPSHYLPLAGRCNEFTNRIALGASHHHHGIHAGVIRAWGKAPDAVHWHLGVRAGAPPLLAYVGDRLALDAIDGGRRPGCVVARVAEPWLDHAETCRGDEGARRHAAGSLARERAVSRLTVCGASVPTVGGIAIALPRCASHHGAGRSCRRSRATRARPTRSAPRDVVEWAFA
jgi:hypothetical protein